MNQPELVYNDLEPKAVTTPTVTMAKYMKSRTNVIKSPPYDQERFVSYLDTSDWSSIGRLHDLIESAPHLLSVVDKNGQVEWGRVVYQIDNTNGITLIEKALPLSEFLKSSEC